MVKFLEIRDKKIHHMAIFAAFVRRHFHLPFFRKKDEFKYLQV